MTGALGLVNTRWGAKGSSTPPGFGGRWPPVLDVCSTRKARTSAASCASCDWSRLRRSAGELIVSRSAMVFLTRLPGNVLRSRDQHAPSMAGGPLGQALRHQLQDVRDPKINASLASRGGDMHQAARVVRGDDCAPGLPAPVELPLSRPAGHPPPFHAAPAAEPAPV